MSILNHNMRFTVMDSMCVRMEFSRKNIFRDLPTLFASCRTGKDAECECRDEDGIFYLKTSAMQIEWMYKYGARPKSGTLRVHQNGKTWHYGKRPDHNLGGVLQSLDGCSEPIPLPEGFLSRDGWTVIDDSSSAVLKDDWLTPDPHEEGYFDLYFFSYGTEYKKALQVLMKISGKVPMLPRWAMGSWYSRWYPYTSDDYRGILQEYRKYKFPLDVIVMDMEWHTRGGDCGWGWGGTIGWTGWTWNRELLPDAEKLLHEFRKQGLKIAMNAHPHDGIRNHEECYKAFMKDMGEDTENGKSLEFDAGNRKYMENYFKHAHTPREKEGCSLWWVDWQQDSIYEWVRGVPGTLHVPWLNRCYYNHMKEGGRRGLSFSRWGGFGDQKHPIHFSGDTSSKWEVLAFQIAFTAISGNSGCFFWTHDMGGFCGERNPELYARWLQFGVVTAAMRLHSAGDDLDRRPWKWNEPFRNSLRKSFRLRSRLMPSLYTFMHNACRDSVPMIRALYIEHPETEECYHNPQEFYLGDNLLAAPITKPGKGIRFLSFQKLYIPDGEWCHFFTGERYTKGTYPIAAELDDFPLFLRAGTILPLGAEDKERMADPDSSFDLLFFPSHKPVKSTFTLYEDDGESSACEQGQYRETMIRVSSGKGKASITIEPSAGKFPGMVEKRFFSLNIRNIQKVQSVTVNGKKIKWTLDEKKHLLKTQGIGIIQEKTVFEVNFTQVPDHVIRRETLKARISSPSGLSLGERMLLEGKGAMPFTDPLTAEEKILVWAEGIKSFKVKENDTVVEGALQCSGTEPLFLEKKDSMEFIYENGFRFSF